MITVDEYALVDSGNGRKLERFGDYLLERPSAQAVWKPQLSQKIWASADAYFKRVTDKEGTWVFRSSLPSSWVINVGGIRMKMSPTPFGHLGIFPEQVYFWKWLNGAVKNTPQPEPKVLNLFAYSGGSTLACAAAGARVCHLDASRPIVGWARENAALSEIPEGKIQWVLDDVMKFVQREVRRGRRYDGIILDPPSFGRGPKKEIFKIEHELGTLLQDCQTLGVANFVLA